MVPELRASWTTTPTATTSCTSDRVLFSALILPGGHSVTIRQDAARGFSARRASAWTPHVAERVAAERIAPRVRLTLPASILLPRVAGPVVAVAVELVGEVVLRPAAVHPPPADRPVGLRERQAGFCQALEESSLEGAEGHANIAIEDGTQPAAPGTGGRRARIASTSRGVVP